MVGSLNSWIRHSPRDQDGSHALARINEYFKKWARRECNDTPNNSTTNVGCYLNVCLLHVKMFCNEKKHNKTPA